MLREMYVLPHFDTSYQTCYLTQTQMIEIGTTSPSPATRERTFLLLV